MVEDGETVLRIVWNTRDFGKEGLKGSAFSRRDLIPLCDANGNKCYVSTDRSELVAKASVDFRIELAVSEKEKRHLARFAAFQCSQLRALQEDRSGLAMFEVMAIPFAAGEDGEGSPPNPAHAGVISTSEDPGNEQERDLKLNELRTALLDSVVAVLDYDGIFPPV